MSKTMTLQCEAGHEWSRPAQRGRPPRWCPQHRAGVDPNSPSEQRRKLGISGPVSRPASITLDPPSVTPAEPENAESGSVDPAISEALARPTRGIQLNGRGKDAIPPRERIHVSDVRVGDWTHITGFRPVRAVKVFPRKKEVKLTWRDGSSKTYPFATKRERENPKPGEDKFEAVPFTLIVLRAEHAARG